MMYNRYIPDAAGVYHPTQVGAQPQPVPAPPPSRVRAARSPASAALFSAPVRRNMEVFVTAAAAQY